MQKSIRFLGDAGCDVPYCQVVQKKKNRKKVGVYTHRHVYVERQRMSTASVNPGEEYVDANCTVLLTSL